MLRSQSKFAIFTIALLFCALHGVAAQSAIFIVRHAEKAPAAPGEKDPELSAAGRARAETIAAALKDAGVSAIYATEYKRTQQTAAAVARAAGLETIVVPAEDTAGLTSRLEKASGNALVVAHSNTIPAIVKALGVAASFTLEEADYDNLFVIIRTSPPQLIRLHLPAPASL